MKFPKPVFASLLGFSIMLTGCRREAPSPAPENVTLLIEDENRILTLGFSEYLAGCIFAAADPSFQEETLLAAGIALSSQAQYCMQNCEADFGADLADRGDIYPDWLSPDELEERYADQYPEWLERVSRVAERAAKECLYYNDGPAYTPCCRVSSGVTDDGGFTYLPALKLSRRPGFTGILRQLRIHLHRRAENAGSGHRKRSAPRRQGGVVLRAAVHKKRNAALYQVRRRGTYRRTAPGSARSAQRGCCNYAGARLVHIPHPRKRRRCWHERLHSGSHGALRFVSSGNTTAVLPRHGTNRLK